MKQRILDTGNLDLVSRPGRNYPRSTFNLSHDVKDTWNVGNLVPVLSQEAFPGDIWHMSVEGLLRFQPLLAPVMHRCDLRFDYFFVADRIIGEYSASASLIENILSPPAEGFNPPPAPTNSTVWATNETAAFNTLSPHLDLPRSEFGIGEVTMWKHAAYCRIMFDWYYDQNFTAEPSFIDANKQFIPLVAGANNDPAVYDFLYNRNYDCDYFTSALPWPQKGPDVIIPVFTDGSAVNIPVGVIDPTKPTSFDTVFGGDIGTASPTLQTGAPNSALFTGPDPLRIDPNGGLGVNVAGAVSGTMNDWRTAMAVQAFLENDSYGTKYIETVAHQFGVQSSDARFQRSQYLGTSSEPIMFSEVLQTSATASGTTPQANMAGHGVTAHRKPLHEHFHCEEHGWIFCIASVLPKTSYGFGLGKEFTRHDRLDYPWPELANTGFQEILNREYFHSNQSPLDTQVWGYQPRYQELRTITNKVRNDFQASLSFWQMSAIPTSLRFLNESFIKCSPGDSVQIFADVETEDTHLIAHIFHSINCERKIPKFGVPGVLS